MSAREFAAHLGVSDRMVSKWERGGNAIRPRPTNQAALDTSLAMAGPEARSRFAHLVAGRDLSPLPAPVAVSVSLPESVCHQVRHPLDGKVMTMIDAGPVRAGGRRPVWLPGFYMDVHPTTHAEYGRFLAATGHRPPVRWPGGTYTIADDAGALHGEPMAGLGWDDACAYARWASKDLPTVAQWERATRGSEGVVTAEMWEWCRVEAGPGRRGPKGAEGGGFRCATPIADLLALLAI